MPFSHGNKNNPDGRFSPQKIIDQAETEQVGGTVVNRNLNRDENEMDDHHAEAKKKDKGDPEDHHINEVEENDKK